MTTGKRQTARKQVANSGIVAGFNHGFQTTKRERPAGKKIRLGVAKKKLRAVKSVIAELCGLTPLEKRIQELLRVGKEKRALKLANKRLGNFTAAKKKKSKVEDYLRAQTATKKH